MSPYEPPRNNTLPRRGAYNVKLDHMDRKDPGHTFHDVGHISSQSIIRLTPASSVRAQHHTPPNTPSRMRPSDRLARTTMRRWTRRRRACSVAPRSCHSRADAAPACLMRRERGRGKIPMRLRRAPAADPRVRRAAGAWRRPISKTRWGPPPARLRATSRCWRARWSQRPAQPARPAAPRPPRVTPPKRRTPRRGRSQPRRCGR